MMTLAFFAAVVAVVTNLPAVVVEASRLDRRPLEMPAAVQVLDAAKIAAAGPVDAVTLLSRQVPELHLRHLGGGNPALAEIAMRGYGENGHGRTLVLIDGERLNAPDMGMPELSRLALNGGVKIEVLGGAQTVLHGDGASAGVVNVITEPQTDERRSYAEIHGGSWGSVGVETGTRGGFAEEGIRYWADGAWDRSDGYRDHSGFDLLNFKAGMRKIWTHDTFLRFSGFFSDARYDLPGALTYREWRADPRQSHATEDDMRRSSGGLAATFGARLDDENELKVSGTFSQREIRGYQRGEGWFSDNDYDIYSYRLLTEWINSTPLWNWDNSFLLGMQTDAGWLRGSQLSSYARQSPRYDRTTLDGYAEDTLHLTDTLALELGGRYSRAWAHNNLCEHSRRADNLWAVSAALMVNPTDEMKFYLKASRSYRNPFLDEVPGRFEAGYQWVNTSLLKPETGWTAELGWAWEMDEWSLGADAYGSRLEDEIFYNSLRGNNENCDDATWRGGVDVHIAWERESVAALAVAVSYVHAQFDGGSFDDKRIPLVPSVTVAVNGRVWLWDEAFLFGGYRYQSGIYSVSDFANALGEVNGWGIFHLGATYVPEAVAWLKGFKFSLVVDNLFDENYCDYVTYGSEYYPAAGRSFTFSVRYEF